MYPSIPKIFFLKHNESTLVTQDLRKVIVVLKIQAIKHLDIFFFFFLLSSYLNGTFYNIFSLITFF